MPKFTHEHYDGKHWIKGTAEYALDNELNRLNKQIMKYAKAGASNSKYYKELTAEAYRLSAGNIKWVNGVPQAKRTNAVIAQATAKHGYDLHKKILKSKGHATFENYKKASKKLGLTPNQLSFINNETSAYFESIYKADGDNEDSPLDIEDNEKARQGNNEVFGNNSSSNPFSTTHDNPHTWGNDRFDQEIFAESIIVPKWITGTGEKWYNVETGELFDTFEHGLESYRELMRGAQNGEYHINTGHWGENINWSDYPHALDKGKRWG